MREIGLLALVVLGGLLTMIGCGDNNAVITGPVGWAIGWRSDNTAAILHTANGGKTWEEQGNPSLWTGMSGSDITAVDAWTAWAAVGNPGGGAILHTTDGGATWNVQPLPEGINEPVKGIKGLSRSVAWAVTLGGTVMHTVNGGQTWVVVPTHGVTLKQVNRMDVLGEDIWIADYGSGAKGMVHSADNGRTWRQEQLPDVIGGNGPMTVSIVNSRVAWTTVNGQGDIYRTTDGGATWRKDAPDVSGANDIDDVCAVNAHEVWAVQNIGGQSAGYVMRVSIVGSDVTKSDWFFTDYSYEGVSAFDERTAWIVGFKTVGAGPNLPDGSILHTSDGKTWKSQTLPVNNVRLWKVSFVGARR